MQIALLQINSRVGDFAFNTKKILDGYISACNDGAELVVFPELALTGYPPQDLLFHESFVDAHEEALSKICKKVDDIGLIIGVIEKNVGRGKPLFNSAVLIHNHSIVVRQRKALLPTYGEFDEHRYFEPNHDGVNVFSYRDKQMAILVCEDIWGNEPEGDIRKLYHRSPVDELKGTGLDLLISVNASPYHLGKGRARFDVVSKVARELECSIVYVNKVGGQDELVFDGGSFAVDKKGNCIQMCTRFSEDHCTVDDAETTKRAYQNDDDIEHLYKPLILGFGDYVVKSELQGAVLGLSGGIDSAVVACIAVAALGKEKVIGVGMPSEWSSEGSVTDAKKLAENLGIRFLMLPIQDIYNSVGDTVTKDIGWNTPGTITGDVTEENVQARARGLLIMTIANRYNMIAVATGNKSELSVGYATLYGDMVGGFGVLKDVFKMDVYRLAQFINRDKIIIPKNTIEKPPSAELAPGQEDSDSLPPYEILDGILKYYIEENKGIEDIVKKGYDRAIVERVIKMVNRAEYKRRQGAPGVLVTRRGLSVGAGRFWPISSGFLPR